MLSWEGVGEHFPGIILIHSFSHLKIYIFFFINPEVKCLAYEEYHLS